MKPSIKKFYKTEKMNNLSEIISRCLQLRDEGFWSFRGHRNQNWDLGLHNYKETNIYRNFEQFRKRCLSFPLPDNIDEKDDWRWLFYAQHHRLKTPLLDWTSNPLVAIYFAVENILSGGRDEKDLGAIWLLKVDDEHFKFAEDLRKPNKESDWLMINPSPITSRLARQSGKFSYHPIGSTSINKLPRRSNEELIKIIIQKDSNGKNPSYNIRRQLGMMNVHHASLFPDHDGVAQFINQEWPSITKHYNE